MANPNLQPTLLGETEAERQAREAEEDRLLDEAEAEAERVGTIPFEEVEAWVRSWGTPNELPPPEPRK
jgi:predicted transcriptional regulator